MTGLVVTGWGAVSAAGVGAGPLCDALAAGVPPVDVTGLYPGPLPAPVAYALVGFDARALLGRRGTTFLDRATAMTLVACRQAIEDSGLVVDDDRRGRVGVALGTTVGSLQTTSDYSRETLVHDRPYLVNPALFPNTVLNCAAGQVAIRYRLEGVNSTVATGPTGFLGALRYAANVLRRGYAETMLVGAVEELTPHAAWAHHRLRRAGHPGEAAVVFVLDTADAARAGGRRPVAEVAAVTVGFHPEGRDGRDGPDGLAAALAGCMRRALAQAGAHADQVSLVATGQAHVGAVDARAVRIVLGGRAVPAVALGDRLGDCGSANGALQFAAALAGGSGAGADRGMVALLGGWSPEGTVAAAVVRG